MTFPVLSKFLMTAVLAILWFGQNTTTPPATKPRAAQPPAKQPAAQDPKQPATQPSLVKPAPRSQPPATSAPATLPPEATALSPDTVIMAVGDQKVTKAEFEALLDGLPEQARKTATGPNRRKMAEELARLKALAQEAKRRKLDQSLSVQQVLELQKEQVLAGSLVKQLQASAKPDDAAMKAWYDTHKGEFETAKVSHILIRFKGSSVPLKKDQKDLSEEEALAKAQEIRTKLQAGLDFATLAKAESDDTSSAANGGSLGTITKGRMVPEFEQVAFTLKVGDISEPVKTRFGYHVIKVEEHSAKTLEEVRPQIEQQIWPEATQKAIESIGKGVQVVINDQYFGSASAPAPAPTAPGVK